MEPHDWQPSTDQIYADQLPKRQKCSRCGLVRAAANDGRLVYWEPQILTGPSTARQGPIWQYDRGCWIRWQN